MLAAGEALKDAHVYPLKLWIKDFYWCICPMLPLPSVLRWDIVLLFTLS